MIGAIIDLVRAILRFPSWWLGELAALLPKGLRRALREQPKWVVLDLSGADLVVSRSVGEKNREVGRVGLDQTGQAQRRAVAKLVRKLNLGNATVVLRLADTHALRKLVDLPAAAEENLREVLGFEMDRQTPFKLDEVHFDYRVVRHDPESERLQAELTVIPRGVVDEAVGRATNWGLPPQIVDIGGEARRPLGELNLLPPERVPAPARSGGVLNFLLGLVAVALMATVIYVISERQNEVAIAVAAELAAAQAEAEVTTALSEEIERLVEDGRFLRERKRGAITMTAVLDELTRVLPDHTWVYQLRLDKGEVRISGYSSAASEIIALIEASPAFHEVKFRSPVTRDARLGLERFNLSAEVGEAGEDTP